MEKVLITVQTILGFAIFAKDNFAEGAKSRKVYIATIIVLMAGVFIFQLYNQSKVDFERQFSGELNGGISSIDTKFPTLTLGGSQSTFIIEEPEGRFMGGLGPQIQIKLKNRRAYLTTEFRDPEGTVIGEIKDNKWFIYNGQQNVKDRNFNRNSLEVIDRKGDILFQVQIKGEDVRIAGYFYRKNGQLDGGKEPDEIRPWIKDTMFKYPSIDYPRELNP